MDTPMRLPEPARTRDEGLNRYLNQIRDCLRTLHSYEPQDKRGRVWVETPGQWTISVEAVTTTWTATVGAGILRIPVFYDDSGGVSMPLMEDQAIAEETLTGLADNTTYGIWLECTAAAPANGTTASWAANGTATATIDSKVGVGEVLVKYTVGGLFPIKDSTNTDADDVYAMVAAGTGKVYFYLGKVAIASGAAIVTQWERTTLTMWAPTWDHGIVSDEANNDISAGTDGGAFYDAP
jgi:hypothetical protein